MIRKKRRQNALASICSTAKAGPSIRAGPMILKKGWQLITLERLFQSFYGESLNRSLYRISDHKERLAFLTEQIIRATGLKDFGIYMAKVLTVDTFFLNEDRHTHNLAVLLDEYGEYHYCPMFDHGGALLSDTTLDYPVTGDVYTLIESAKPKTFCGSFEEQLDIAEELYGQPIQFSFNSNDIDRLLREEQYYSEDRRSCWKIRKNGHCFGNCFRAEQHICG